MSRAAGKPSLVSPSEAVSSAVWVASRQAPAGLTNTYAAPWNACVPTLWEDAPATIVSPEIATVLPSPSEATPSEAVSRAIGVAWAQPAAGRWNTKTSPWASLAPTLRPGAPTASVSPDNATAANVSPATPSASVSFAACTSGSTRIG